MAPNSPFPLGSQRSLTLLYKLVPSPIQNGLEEAFMETLRRVGLSMAGLQKKTIMVNGVQTPYLFRHLPGKPTLVFLHGFGDNKYSFMQLARLLREYSIFIPDQPGFGETTRDRSLDYSEEFYADWLAAFITQLELGPVHLAGNSMGGALAMHLGRTKPEFVRSLILLNPGGVSGDEVQGIYREILSGQNVFDIRTEKEYDAFLARLFYRKPRIPILLHHYMLKRLIRTADWHNHLFFRLSGPFIENNRQSATLTTDGLIGPGELRALGSLPVLTIWGVDDGLFPDSISYYLDQHIPNHRLIRLRECGHVAHVERPDWVAKHLHRFIWEV